MQPRESNSDTDVEPEASTRDWGEAHCPVLRRGGLYDQQGGTIPKFILISALKLNARRITGFCESVDKVT